ncbi:hypothetical protein [Sphingobium tyrosinilyticum]|uniref:Uncharacterized protein n=1 Tax=Sphingobium tyrosinilyticum TaxID=2715436 RepID=A0ABV9F4E6_9SPHN
MITEELCGQRSYSRSTSIRDEKQGFFAIDEETLRCFRRHATGSYAPLPGIEPGMAMIDRQL